MAGTLRTMHGDGTEHYTGSTHTLETHSAFLEETLLVFFITDPFINASNKNHFLAECQECLTLRSVL